MIKPAVMPDPASEEQLMLVVEVGKVKLALPPRLSKIVQLFNEQGNHTKINGECHVLHDTDHVIPDSVSYHSNGNQNTLSKLTNGQVENDSRTVKLTNGFHTPSPDISEKGHSRERRDYRGLVKVHKSKRKLPQLPTDPKMSIFNNIDKLGVLEAELDVTKLEVKIRRQRQKVAAEFRSLTPEQRHELVVESPYLQKQIQRAIKSRAVNRSSTLSDITAEQEDTISVTSTPDSLLSTASTSNAPLSPCNVTSSPRHVTSSPRHVTSSSTISEDLTASFSSSLSTATCSTPKHSPPTPPSILLDSTLSLELPSNQDDLVLPSNQDDLDDSLDAVTSCSDLIGDRSLVYSACSPIPLPQTFEDEIVSICSSVPEHHYSTPTTTPTLQQPSSSSSSSSTPSDNLTPDLNLPPPLAPSEKLLSDTDLPPPPPSDLLSSYSPNQDKLGDNVYSKPLLSLEVEEELPPYSEHDLTFVTPLSNRELSNNQNRELNQYQNRDQSQYQNSYSTEALEISHTPVQDQSRKVLSDSQVNMINVHTPISCHENLVARQRHAHQDPPAQQSSVRRSELCTPIRSSSLSASDSQLHKKKITDDKESYERAQSVPYGMEKNGVSSTVENILAKKFTNQKKSYSSKSITDKLEEIQSKHSPRSFLNSSQDVSSYTLSYEDGLGDAGNNLYDDVILSPDQVSNQNHIASDCVETDTGCKVALQLDFDADEFVTQMNARNEKENILSNIVSTELGTEPADLKSRDTEDTFQGIDTAVIRQGAEEERRSDVVVDGLSRVILNDIISSYTEPFTPPPPPYVSTTVEMRVAHSTEEVRNLAEQAVDYFTACVRCGTPINLNREPTRIPEYADPVSYRAFCKLLTCQAHELFLQAALHFDLMGPAVKPPPWIRDLIRPPQPPWLLKHRRPRPHTLESVKPLICEEVVAVTTTQFYSIEGILSKEVVQSDAQWQDFNKDEVAMKFRLADILLVNLLQDTVNSFKRVAAKKEHDNFTQEHDNFSCEKTSSEQSYHFSQDSSSSLQEKSVQPDSNNLSNHVLFEKADFIVPIQRYSRQRTLSF